MKRNSDPRPPIELIGEADLEQQDQRVQVGVGPTGRRNALLLAAVVGLALVAGLVLSDDGGDEPERRTDPRDAEPDGTSAEPSPVSTAGPSSTLVDEGGPVFGSPVGASLLLGSERGWRSFDLDTGLLQEVPELAGVGPEDMIPVAGGVVVLEDITGPLEFVGLPLGASRPLTAVLPDPPRLAGVVGVIPSGRPDRLWLTWALMDPDAQDQLAVLSDLEGRPIGEEFVVRGTPVTGTMTGLVFSAGGKTYLNGTKVTYLSDGVARTASAFEVGVLTCDEGANCSPAIIDTMSGEVRRGPTIPGTTHGSTWMSLSPDGRVLVIPAHELPPITSPVGFTQSSRTLFIVDANGSYVSGDVEDLRSEPTWLPGELGAVAMTGYGLVRLYPDAGALATERVPGVRAGFDDTVLVIPRP